MTELRPYPFCGNKYVTIAMHGGDGCYRVDCVQCGIMFYLTAGAAKKSKMRVIDAWNRRANDE